MFSYYARHYRSVSPGMRAGTGHASLTFAAANNEDAIASLQELWRQDFDPLTDTIYLWLGNRLVWGTGLEAGPI